MQQSMPAVEFGVSPGAGFYLDSDNLERSLSDLDELDTSWIRSTIPWKNFQPDDPSVVGEDASWNWKAVDEFIATMNSTQWNGRFRIITTIDNPPEWAKTPGGATPFDLQAYATAAAALADRLQGVSHVFEIQNSPNIGMKGPAHGNTICTWPVPDPAGYAQLLKLVYPAIKAVRPRCVVLVGGLGGAKNVDGERIAADDFLQALYDNDAQEFFDGVSYHPYSTPHLPCAPQDPICVLNLNYVSAHKDPYGMSNGWSRMLNARQIMVDHGDDAKDIWITEFGGPTGSTKALTEAEQANLLTAGVTRASQYDWVHQFNWFRYQDDPSGEEDEIGGDHMGLLRADGSRKPAFAAYRALIH